MTVSCTEMKFLTVSMHHAITLWRDARRMVAQDATGRNATTCPPVSSSNGAFIDNPLISKHLARVEGHPKL